MVSRVQIVKNIHKASFKDQSEHDAGSVGPPQGPLNMKSLSFYFFYVLIFRALLSLYELFLLLMPSVGNMHGHQQCRSGDKDELKGPQSDVRNGEKVIIANIFASGLQSVADKIILLITPDLLCSNNQDHYAENEEDGQPYLANTGGMFVHATQNVL